MFRDWLQLFRAQTAPATIMLILVPYLTSSEFFRVETFLVGTFALLAHWISFGHNSLMDTAMGYDIKDPSKKHHALVVGRISMTKAHNVIHWSLSGLAIASILLSFQLSPNPVKAITSVFLWFVFGYSYNSGLSKESTVSFIPISVCFTSMGAWGWFLTHSSLDNVGWLLLSYFFMTVLFQISWSGNLKELALKERSNILVKMKAEVVGETFHPGKAWIYAWTVKGINLLFAVLLLFEEFNYYKLVWTLILLVLAITFLYRLTKPRKYLRGRELLNMSIMEIVTIYLLIPLVLPWLEATMLMLFGVTYFFLMNLWLWRVPYPAV